MRGLRAKVLIISACYAVALLCLGACGRPSETSRGLAQAWSQLVSSANPAFSAPKPTSQPPSAPTNPSVVPPAAKSVAVAPAVVKQDAAKSGHGPGLIIFASDGADTGNAYSRSDVASSNVLTSKSRFSSAAFTSGSLLTKSQSIASNNLIGGANSASGGGAGGGVGVGVLFGARNGSSSLGGGGSSPSGGSAAATTPVSAAATSDESGTTGTSVANAAGNTPADATTAENSTGTSQNTALNNPPNNPPGGKTDSGNPGSGSSENSGGSKPPDGNSGSGTSSSGTPTGGTARTALVSTGDSNSGTSNSGTPPGGQNTGVASDAKVTTTQFLVASSNGTLGSQAPTETLGDYMLIPAFVFTFLGEDKLQEWEYMKDAGQEIFPTVVKISEFSLSDGAHPTICPGRGKCEGRVLRWFDLGVQPADVEDTGNYLARLKAGKLVSKQLNAKVSYQDFVVGANNQISLPKVLAETNHIYFILMAPEGTVAASTPMEFNLQSPDDWDKFQATVTPLDYAFVRGFMVKSSTELMLQYNAPTPIQLNPLTH